MRVSGLDDVIDIAASGTSNFGFSGAVKRDGTVAAVTGHDRDGRLVDHDELLVVDD